MRSSSSRAPWAPRGIARSLPCSGDVPYYVRSTQRREGFTVHHDQAGACPAGLNFLSAALPSDVKCSVPIGHVAQPVGGATEGPAAVRSGWAARGHSIEKAGVQRAGTCRMEHQGSQRWLRKISNLKHATHMDRNPYRRRHAQRMDVYIGKPR